MKKIFVLLVTITASFFAMNAQAQTAAKADDAPSRSVQLKIADKPKPIIPGGDAKQPMDTKMPATAAKEEKYVAPPPAFKTAPVPAAPPVSERKPLTTITEVPVKG